MYHPFNALLIPLAGLAGILILNVGTVLGSTGLISAGAMLFAPLAGLAFRSLA